MRHPTPAGPAEQGAIDGLEYTLWLPERPPEGGVVVLHGAGSTKENHHDMARAARGGGLAAVAFDMRGHGATGGALDGRVLDDVETIASLLPRPLALRGSSMGGFIAIAAAERLQAQAIVAVCPASAEGLRRGLRSGELDFPADLPALEALLDRTDLFAIVERSAIPLMLLHAEADERVPASHSRELFERSAAPVKRLVVLPGGHHRSVQHDAEMQGESLRFIHRAFTAGSRPRPPLRRQPDR
jgi:alpha-beta hydrolase superfamily lysophospholipase